MTEKPLDSEFIEIVRPVIASAASVAIVWLAGERGYFAAALTTLFAVVGARCAGSVPYLDLLPPRQ